MYRIIEGYSKTINTDIKLLVRNYWNSGRTEQLPFLFCKYLAVNIHHRYMNWADNFWGSYWTFLAISVMDFIRLINTFWHKQCNSVSCDFCCIGYYWFSKKYYTLKVMASYMKIWISIQLIRGMCKPLQSKA